MAFFARLQLDSREVILTHYPEVALPWLPADSMTWYATGMTTRHRRETGEYLAGEPG